MKRFVVPLFALLALVLPLTAQAGWVTKEVKWRISSVGAPFNATAIYVRDTSVTSIGPVDTTASFSIDAASVMPRGILAPGIQGQSAVWPFGTTQNDTTVIAFLEIAPDTTVIPTPGFTSVTALIDGRVGGFGSAINLSGGWVKADSALANGAAGGGMILGDHTISFPIRTMSPYGSIFRFGELRARITGVGGSTGLAAARVFLRYFHPDIIEHY